MGVYRKLKESLLHYTWKLAYFDYNPSVLVNGIDFKQIHIVTNPYKNKWFADPFILKDSKDELILMVEEFDNKIKRGRIAQIKIDKNKDLIVSCDIILDLPTHLSFPVIYYDGKKVLVHPENSASGSSYMYEYNEYMKKLINPVKVLDEPITDAIITNCNNEFIMYATRMPEPNGCALHTYKASNFRGPYYAKEVLELPQKQARMAGLFIDYEGKLIRPAQDCNGAYGKAVVFYEGCKEIGEIRPINYKYAGIHTFNKLDDICVIDLKCYDYPLFVFFKDKIKKVLWGK